MNILSKGILLLFIILLFVPNYNFQTLDAVTRYGDCSEEYVRKFSMNEVAEINCNGTILESITDITGVRFLQQNNSIILPFLQTYARKSLLRIATSSLRTIYVVDAFRSVSLAFLRIQQRRNGICNGDVQFYDKPGSFGFDSGLGLKIKTDVLLNQYFVDEGWIVEQNDNVTNVIYNVIGLVKDVRYLAIRLFQRHWNIDKDMSTIEETGIMDRDTIKSMSMYNISGYEHTCPKDYWILEPNKNVRFMLVVLVPMFFVLTVFLLWFAAVHVTKNDSATPLSSKKRFHLDPQLAQTAPTVQEVEFKPVSTMPKQEVKQEESKQDTSEDTEIYKKKRKSHKKESSSAYSSTFEGEYEEGEDQYEYEFFSEDEDEDDEQYEWEDLGDEEGGYEFFGEDENENEDENEYTYEEEDEYEEGEDEDENETDYTSDRD